MKTVLSLTAALFLLSACNTIEGVGQDTSAAARGTSNAITKATTKDDNR